MSEKGKGNRGERRVKQWVARQGYKGVVDVLEMLIVKGL